MSDKAYSPLDPCPAAENEDQDLHPQTQRPDRPRKNSKARANVRPPAFNPEFYCHRNTVEYGLNRLKHWRGAATWCDKYALAYLDGLTPRRDPDPSPYPSVGRPTPVAYLMSIP